MLSVLLTHSQIVLIRSERALASCGRSECSFLQAGFLVPGQGGRCYLLLLYVWSGTEIRNVLDSGRY